MNALAHHPGFSSEIVTLPDGTTLLLRAMTLADVPRLRDLHGRLSPTTIYRRFMAPVPRVSDRVLHYLASVDHRDREAIVAQRCGEIVAVARYHKLAPDEAELAVLVEDAWQGRGLGRILAERIADAARANGVRVFSGSMLPENTPAKRMLLAMFPGARAWISQGELLFRAPLVADTEPPTPAARSAP